MTIDTIAAINRISNFEQDYHIDPIIDSISHNLLQICPVSDVVEVPDSVAYLRYIYMRMVVLVVKAGVLFSMTRRMISVIHSGSGSIMMDKATAIASFGNIKKMTK